MILPCTCQHENQSCRYGGNNRVHNEFQGTAGPMYRCTVCLTERGVGKTISMKTKKQKKKK